MKRSMLMGCLVVVFVATPGCRSAFYGPRVSYPHDGFVAGAAPAVFRVCFDRDGTLYVDPREPTLSRLEFNDQWYTVYREDQAAAGQTTGPTDATEPAAGTGAAAAGADRAFHCRMSPTERVFARQLAARLGAAAAERKPVLVVLIHGYDTKYRDARHAYGLARQQIATSLARLSPAQSPVFLEVYWDAYRQPCEWPWARASGRMVGHVGLRRLLQQLATELRDYGPLDEVAVRIVAHGRGAELACGALWDFANTTRHPECDLAKLRQRQPAKEAVDRPLPFADLRVGFVAAAMGTDVLRHYAEFDQVGVDAFVLGNSTCDWVLYKRLLGWVCEPLVPVLALGQASLGKTSVGRGCRGGWAVRRVTKALAGTDTEVYWLDFGQSSHDLCRYVRNPLFPRFLDDLLAPAHSEDRLPSRPKPGA